MNSNKGLSIVEVLITIALLSVLVIGVMQLVWLGVKGGDEGIIRAQAAELAEEGMEAMFDIRESGGVVFLPSPMGDSFITGVNEYYQPSIIGTSWVLGSKLSAQPPASLLSPYAKFTRIVTVEKVYRYLAGIACTGQIVAQSEYTCDDYNSRKITVTVSWQSSGITNNYTLTTVIANI